MMQASSASIFRCSTDLQEDLDLGVLHAPLMDGTTETRDEVRAHWEPSVRQDHLTSLCRIRALASTQGPHLFPGDLD